MRNPGAPLVQAWAKTIARQKLESSEYLGPYSPFDTLAPIQCHNEAPNILSRDIDIGATRSWSGSGCTTDAGCKAISNNNLKNPALHSDYSHRPLFSDQKHNNEHSQCSVRKYICLEPIAVPKWWAVREERTAALRQFALCLNWHPALLHVFRVPIGQLNSSGLPPNVLGSHGGR